MTSRFQHLGWLVSPYSAKTRAAFRFKRVPFDDREPSARELLFLVRRRVGRVVMPVVLTPEGELWQDSSEILDAIEARFPEPSIVPRTPRQRLASELGELYGDEWLPTVALAMRWMIPSNTRFAIGDFGRAAAPMLPRAAQRAVGARIARQMQAYLPLFGIDESSMPGIERTFEALIAALDAHLALHPYLLGGRPCAADFSIFGMLWAHPYRDVGTTHRFGRVPNVRAWFERMLAPPSRLGSFLPDDEVPESLDPLLRLLFEDAMPFFLAIARSVDAYVEAHPGVRRVPRSLGEHPARLGGSQGVDVQRTMLSYAQWMLQRPLDTYAALDAGARREVDPWLRRVGGEAAVSALRQPIRHRIVRKGYREWLEGHAP